MGPLFPQFDRSVLHLEPLRSRRHLLDTSCILPLVPTKAIAGEIKTVASRILSAKKNGAPVVLMMGAHVLRSGVQKYIIDLLEKGYLSCIAMNGAGIIHDFEFSLIGATTESVSEYIREGKFGLWKETGTINDIVKSAAEKDMGLGEAVGKFIMEKDLPCSDISVLAAAYRCGCPVTAHVGIGYDILHEHPNCDGAAYGKTSYIDFLRFAAIIESLEGGVVMNFGSAVMAPEVYLKALAMARNVAFQTGKSISNFAVLVCDLAALPDDYRKETSAQSHGYYFRPWKTMLVRTVAEGGESFYVQGKHKDTVPQLWTAINDMACNKTL